MKILFEEQRGPNPYDRRYVICPHDTCSTVIDLGEKVPGCPDQLVVEFHKGHWTASAPSVEIVDEAHWQ